jgi:hypothetical protein
MKKISVIFVVIFVLAFTLGMTVKNATASPLSADGEWNMGTEVNIDLTAHPAPQEWLQLFGDGVKIDTGGTICHPFREGQFGWTPVIYQLTGFGWYELPTTNEKASSEGEYQACATTAYPGTFALFGYYVPPANAAQQECTTDTSEWYMEYWDVTEDEDLYPGYEGWYLYAGTDPLPAGTRVTYELLEGFDGLTVDASGSTISYDYNPWFVSADFMNNPAEWTEEGTATFRLSAAGCSAIVEVEFYEEDIIDPPCEGECCDGGCY